MYLSIGYLMQMLLLVVNQAYFCNFYSDITHLEIFQNGHNWLKKGQHHIYTHLILILLYNTTYVWHVGDLQHGQQSLGSFFKFGLWKLEEKQSVVNDIVEWDPEFTINKLDKIKSQVNMGENKSSHSLKTQRTKNRLKLFLCLWRITFPLFKCSSVTRQGQTNLDTLDTDSGAAENLTF